MSGSEESGTLTWAVWPARTQRAKAVSTLAVVVATVYGALYWGGLILGVLAVFVLLGAVGPFFVRTRYRLTADEVSVRSPFQRTRRSWGDFRRVYVGDQGVSLSPFHRRHFLEPYRSVMLRFGEHREEVLEWVRKYGPRTTAESGES